MRPRSSFALLVGLLALGAACQSDETGNVVLSVGGEPDALTAAPAVTRAHVEIDADGSPATVLYDGPLSDGLSLDGVDDSTVGRVAFTGFDGSGAARVFGVSPPIQLGGLTTGDLTLFVQRKGAWAKAPSTFSASATQVTTSSDRYLVAVEPDAPALVVYDLLRWQFGTREALAEKPLAIVVNGVVALVLTASRVYEKNLTDGTEVNLTPPAGLSLADFAGARAFYTDKGSAFLVAGSARTAVASDAVLFIDPNGAVSLVHLTKARRGAAAAWLVGRGLVVAGGSDTAAGAEVLPSDGTAVPSTAAPLPYAPLADNGLDAIALDGSRILLGSPPRALDAACAAACALDPWAVPALDLSNAWLEPTGGNDGESILVGASATGQTHAFIVTRPAATELPLRVARQGATLTKTTGGYIALVGGGADTFETFIR